MNQSVDTSVSQKENYSTNIKLSFKQRFNYAVSEFGYNAIYFWVSAFMMIYFTDVIGVSAGMVSMLILVVRIFDGVNDPIIGSIADRTNSRWGRYKPWVGIGGTIMGILIVLLFSARPGWSDTGKIVYMWVIYIAVTIASTCCNMPFGALNGILTSDSGERNKLAALRMVFANCGAQVSGIIAMPLIMLIASTTTGPAAAGGYTGAVAICVIVGVPLLIYTAVKVKEVVKQPPKQKKIPLSKQFACFFKNRYAIIAAFGFFMTGIGAYGRMAMLIYYFQYVAKNPIGMSIAGFVGLAAGLLGSGVLSVFVYAQTRHKGRAVMVSYLLAAVTYLAMFFFPSTNILFWIFMFLSQLFFSAANSITYGLIGDAVDVGEHRYGVRVDGFLASFGSLMLKVGGAIGPAVMLLIIDKLGYVPNAATQPQGVLTALNASISIVLAICSVVGAVVFAFYNMDEKKHAEIRAEIEQRHEQQRQELIPKIEPELS